MSEGIAVKGTRRRAAQSCRHHWLIETPNGATSRGVCKRCGAKKRYPNVADDALRQTGGAKLGRWSRTRSATVPSELSLGDNEAGGY